jgi:hypothetical protein
MYDFITVVSVYGHNDGASSIPSLLRSVEALPGSKALLLSISSPPSLPESIFWKKIPKLNYQQYSLFMIYSLASFIQTDFALCVQADGWVLNQSVWTDNFLEYDYIGAPTAVGFVKPKSESEPGFRWEQSLVRGGWQWIKEVNSIGVLNGGFSLRSKKFLNAPRDIGIPYAFDDQPLRQNEDLQLCLFMRSQLELHGIKFPPLDVAKKFAFEHFSGSLHTSFDHAKFFGIHGSYMRLVGYNQILLFTNNVNSEIIDTYKNLILYLEKLGYIVNVDKEI